MELANEQYFGCSVILAHQTCRHAHQSKWTNIYLYIHKITSFWKYTFRRKNQHASDARNTKTINQYEIFNWETTLHPYFRLWHRTSPTAKIVSALHSAFLSLNSIVHSRTYILQSISPKLTGFFSRNIVISDDKPTTSH